MLIYNIKLNKRTIFKIVLVLMLIICISLGIIALYTVLTSLDKKNDNIINDSIPSSEIAVLTPENYANVLKAVHENIDTYIGQKISFSGYIYRLSSFSENQFVLARDMDIGNNQSLIIGFLCSSEKSKDFENYSWVNVVGEITKGYYNNCDIPILQIHNIEKTPKPQNTTVSLPDDAYIPTAVIY